MVQFHRNYVDLEVELFSKTDGFKAFVRADLCHLLPFDGPEEPADGTILDATNVEDHATFFLRRDEAAPADQNLRYVRRWRDVSADEWIDWPEAHRRGADPARIVTRTFTAGSPE